MAKKKSAKKKSPAKKSGAKKPRAAGAKKPVAKKKKSGKAAPARKATKTSKPASKSTKRAAKKTAPKRAKKTTAKSPKKKTSPKPAPAQPAAGSAVSTARAPGAPVRRTKKPNARKLAKIRELLFRKRASIRSHLETELLELEKPEEKRHRADLEEVASDTHEKDSLCEILDIGASQIGQIEAALQKIENGTYGICEDCNDDIAPARLEALPFATQCIDCKRKAEQGAAISRL